MIPEQKPEPMNNSAHAEPHTSYVSVRPVGSPALKVGSLLKRGAVDLISLTRPTKVKALPIVRVGLAVVLALAAWGIVLGAIWAFARFALRLI
ncbi:hypothetical protein PQ455_09505 [Sphingomonas naphthae]|uniref:Uncharacterized protein n=1 Tax=Sphingomonas naphthae TaxID=1813468 RepID=A0ABY7TJ23_9SPHN|nr:hypothetical protein [Sphingomonas naphthae]WCT71889.1 hypothetical protein PQ455_09505 [Sphingomonas naphthae]